jgi:hypothetical protein
MEKNLDQRSGIWDKHPGSYFQKKSVVTIFGFTRYLDSLLRIESSNNLLPKIK